MKKYLFFLLLLIYYGQNVFAQMTFNSTSPHNGSTSTFTGGPLGTATSTVTVTATTSGCRGYGFNYKSASNGFSSNGTGANCTAGTFVAAKRWDNPVLSALNKTVTLTMANQSVTGCVSGAATRTWNNIRLVLTITSSGTNHVWTVNTTTGDISAPATGGGSSLVFTVSETASVNGGAQGPVNVTNVYAGCGTGTLTTCSRLTFGWMAYTANTLAPSAVAICTGGTISLVANPSGQVPSPSNGATSTWAWTGGNGTYTGSSQNPTVTGATGTPTYTVNYTDNNNCPSTSQTVSPSIVADPTSGVPTGTLAVCSGTGTTLSVAPSGGTGTFSYSWEKMATSCATPTGVGTNSASLSTGNLTNVSNSPVDHYYRCIISQSGSGCGTITTGCTAVTVNPNPVLTSSATGSACSGVAQTSYTPASSGVPISSYSWSRASVTNITPAINSSGSAGAGGSPITEALTNATAAPINVPYSLILKGTAGGCLTNATYTLTVNPKPTVAMTPASQGPGCSPYTLPSTIVFSNPNAVPGTTNYTWSRDKTTELTGIAASGGPGIPSAANISGTLTNTTSSQQIVTFTGYATSAFGCQSNNATSTVTVNPKPTAPTIGGAIYNDPTFVTLTGCGSLTIYPAVGTNGTTCRFYNGLPPSAGGSGVILNPPGSSGATSYTISSVTTGTDVYITSYNATTGCESSDYTHVRMVVTSSFTYTPSVTNVSCNGSSNGSAQIASITGGTSPFTFNWSGSGSGGTGTAAPVTRTGLAAGSYTVTVSDFAGCTNIQNFTVTEPALLQISSATLSSSTAGGYNINCAGGTGSISPIISGGTAPYTYAWTSSPAGFTSISQNISGAGVTARTFTLVVTDNKLCTATDSYTLTEPPALNAVVNVGYVCGPSTYLSANIALNGSGGVAPYTYNNASGVGAYTSTNTYNVTSNSTYTNYRVQDANGCIYNPGGILVNQINQPASAGAACDAVYISPNGSGTNGTKDCPTDLITGLSLFSASRPKLLLLAGTYTINQVVDIPNPGSSNTAIIIDGGYQVSGSDWVKTSNAATILNITSADITSSNSSGKIGLRAVSRSNFTVQDITINASAVSGTINRYGKSVYGIYLSGCSNYSFIRCNVSTGNATSGLGGLTAGSVGANGSGGNNGGGGSCDGGNGGGGNGGSGGGGVGGGSGNGVAGSTAPAGRNGGGGGSGGNGGPEGNNSGTNGGCGGGSNGGSQNCSGGGGASGCNSPCNPFGQWSCTAPGGSSGSSGSAGSDGATGSAGAAGTYSTYFVPGAIAGTGVDGTGGRGGRGGGGGGGQGGTCADDGGGNGGGGGGGGGQGGTGGTGGYGGGSTFGFFSWSNGGSGNIVDCSFSPGNAGSGGSGAAGGAGGSGAGGGNGANTCTGEVGAGGNGGSGGNGGDGGQGGTAAAGVQTTVFVNGTALVTNTSGIPSTNGPVTVNQLEGCAYSEIVITKGGGSFDFGAPMGSPSVVMDQNPTTSTTNTNGSTSPSSIYYTTTGVRNVVVGSTVYRNFIDIRLTRTLPGISVVQSSVATTSPCKGIAVTISTTGTPSPAATAYEWTIVSGTTGSTPSGGATGATTTHTFTSTGTYYVKLRIKSDCCGWSIPIYATLTVVDVPSGTGTLTSSSGDFNFCPGETATLTIGGITSATSYDWIFPSGTTGSATTTGLTNSVTFGSTAGNITITPNNNCGSAPSFQRAITINSVPAVTISGAPVTLCSATSIVLGSGVSSGTSPYNYTWSPPGFISGAVNGSSATTTALTASQTYTLIVIDNNNCSDTVSALVTVQNVPTAGTISGNQSICTGGDPVAFTSGSAGTGSGAITYRWEKAISPFSSWSTIGGATAATYDPPSGLADITRYRRITVSTLNSVACESAATATIEVTVVAQPGDPTSVTQTPSSSPVCSGTNVSVSSPTGGNAGLSCVFEYRFQDAGSGSWTAWTTTSSYTTAGFGSGSNAAKIQVRRGSCQSGCTTSAGTFEVTWNVVPALLNSGFRTWTGMISTAWDVDLNWDCGGIPTISDNVIIPASVTSGNYPNIANTVTGNCRTIRIDGPPSGVTIQTGGTLNVAIP